MVNPLLLNKFVGWLVVVTLALLAQPVLASGKVALVIGNSSYIHTAALPNPVRDARAIAAKLRSIGFDVTLVENMTMAQSRPALGLFAEKAFGADIAIAYYAGHGMEISGTNYLIPVDARMNSEMTARFEAVALPDVLQSVRNTKRLSAVLLDACRNNPFATSMTRTDNTRAVSRGLARVEASPGMIISYAAEEGTTADDGDGDHSPYTAALLSVLDEPELEIGLMFRRVRGLVRHATSGRQQPREYSALSEDAVYLVPPRKEAQKLRMTKKPVFTSRFVRRKAVMLLNREGVTQGPHEGTVDWSIEGVSQNGQKIRATVDIPSVGLSGSIVAEVNIDPDLPASHIVSIELVSTDDKLRGGIEYVRGIGLKDQAHERSVALSGGAAKVDANFFLFALSGKVDDRLSNLALLRYRKWMDVMLAYPDGSRVVLTLQKDGDALKLFADAMDKWALEKPVSNVAAISSSQGVASSGAADSVSPARSADLIIWESIKDTDSVAMLETFIEEHPNSPFVGFARARAEEIKSKVAAVQPQLEVQSSPPKELWFLATYDDLDFYGGDIYPKGVDAATEQMCAQTCADNVQCNVYTFNEPAKRCFLKSDFEYTTQFSGAKSGLFYRDATGESRPKFPANWRIFQRHDMQGGDYSTLRVNSYQQCFAACNTDNVCHAFTYSPARGGDYCFLKTKAASAPTPYNKSGVTSGFKEEGVIQPTQVFAVQKK